MLGRIVKFRRGDQYEEMQGRDVAGKTTEALSDQTLNVNSRGQPNKQTDVLENSTVAPQDATPDGTFYYLEFYLHVLMMWEALCGRSRPHNYPVDRNCHN